MTAAIASIFNPFPGLRSFEPSEAHLFFGRDAHVDELVRKLGRSHFVAVVGTSGSGKSSLVRAGLIPSLESGYLANAGSGWKIALLRPGLDPIQSLARSLARFDNPAEAGYDLETRQVLVETTLRRSSLGLIAAAREIGISSSNNLLVIVDQFKEIFRFRRNRESDAELHENTGAFVKMLLEAAGAPDRDIFVVLTMRSDFLGDCPQFPGLPEAINDGQYLIPRMSRDERRTAIEGPIAVGESEITARLVQRLQNDVGENPDQLPVLQHALMRAWDRWHESKGPDELIDVDDYERIGTMAHALSLHSDEALQSLSPTQQVVARQTFQALCEKDIEGREMRRPAKLSEICAITEQREQEVLAVIDAFRSQGRTFLLPPYPEPIRSTSIIDISHESLIRLWDRLRGWVEAEAQSAATYGRLADAALRFNAGAGSLWRDPELRLALDWKERFRPNQAWADRYHPAFAAAIEFLDRSGSAREAQARRRRMMLAGLVVATAFCALLAAAALLMWRNSESEKHKAIAAEKRAISSERNARTAKEEADHRRLDAQFERDRARLAEQRAKESAAREKAVATERQRALEENRTLQRSVLSRYLGREAAALMPYPHTLQTAALLAVESLKHDPSLEGRSALLEILMVLPEVVYPKPIGAADAYRLVATNQMPANDGTILASRFTRDNKRVLVVRRISPEGLIAELVDFASGDITRTLDLKERVVHWAIDNAGSKLAVTDPSGLVRLFEMPSGNLLFSERVDAPTALSVSSQGDLLAVGTRTGKLLEFDARTKTKLAEWSLACSASMLEFRNDRQALLSLCGDRIARIAAVRPTPTVTSLSHDADITTAHFAPDANTLMTGTKDGTVSLFAASGGGPVWQARAAGAISSLAFTPSGKFAAFSSDNGWIRLVETASGKEASSIALGNSRPEHLEISPDGRLLLASDTLTVHVFGTASGTGFARLGTSGLTPSSLRSSFDSNFIALGGNGSLQILQNHSGELAGIDDLHTFGLAQLSPGGHFIAIGRAGNILQILDGERHREVWHADVGSPFLFSNFSPDERYVAVSDQQARATVFELATGRRIAQLQELVYSRNAGVQAPPALSADAAYVATGNGDRHAQVFETRTGKELFRAGYGGPVSAVALDREGNLLAVAQDRVRIYDLASKRLIRRIDTGNLAVFSVAGRSFQSAFMFNSAIAFSPDRRTLAAALSDHSVRLFDIDSGKELLRIHHHGLITGLRFGIDGKRLIITENVSRIVIHPLDPEELIARTCSLVTRNLTTDEWSTYIQAEPFEKTCPALP